MTSGPDHPSVNLTAKFGGLALLFSGAIAFFVGTISRSIIRCDMGSNPLMNSHPKSIMIDLGAMPSASFITHVFPQKEVSEEDLGDDDVGEDESGTPENSLPAGQHFSVDIKEVDFVFLNSEERIVHAMLGLIEQSKAALVSYHCTSAVPLGVSCVGVSSHSHVSVRTWPSEGVIVIDLFTPGIERSVPGMIPVVKEFFAIPSYGYSESAEPRMLWFHKLRGFREGFSPAYIPHENPLESGLAFDLLRKRSFDMKMPLLSDQTNFQHVDIYELIDPRINSLGSYQRSLSDDGSYESLHPELYSPEKFLFLDGVQQSTLLGEAAYHEALVHPSMITHPNPKRVAIIGGGEGATLREVLKHNTVDEVMMVEIDGKLVEMCREHMPEFSNCSDFVGGDADSCFDDSRASVDFKDAFGWFIDNFHDRDAKKSEKFDVIIMDALDPDQFVAIVGSLYKDDAFVESLFNGLSEEGVFVVQMGAADFSSEPGKHQGPGQDAALMMESLEHAGFESMHIYDEGHSHYESPWSYLVCLKGSISRGRWYETAAKIEIEIHQRLQRTKSGKPILSYFSGPTMLKYQLPPKSDEIVFCRTEPRPHECNVEYRGINPKLVDPISQLKAQQSSIAEYSGQSLQSTVFNPIFERHLRQLSSGGVTTGGIKSG